MEEESEIDNRAIRLDAAAWAEFTSVINRPAKRIPELARLLSESPPWEA